MGQVVCHQSALRVVIAAPLPHPRKERTMIALTLALLALTALGVAEAVHHHSHIS